MTQELRMFTFGHFMLSSIQQGIQAAHAITEMFVNYPEDSDDPVAGPLYKWAEDHKTLVCKNGGDTEALDEIHDLFTDEDNNYPWHWFSESSKALNSSITCVAIVLPERIFAEGKDIVFSRHAEYKYYEGEHHYWLDNEHYVYNDFEYNLIRLLRNCRHAQ